MRSGLRTEWEVLGGIGRVATVGLALSLVLAVLLGVGIPSAVERSLLDAHLATLSVVVGELAEQHIIGVSAGESPRFHALDQEIREHLIGVDVVRVKVWDRAGTVLYSDLTEIVGRTFPLSGDLIEAFRGEPRAGHAEMATDEHAGERSLGHLWEFYVPVTDESSGEVLTVFEVYERTATLHAALASIRTWVWLAVGSGLAVLLVFNVNLVAANSLALIRRRDQAERLFADLARAQEEERSRIIGALHDDIGQPLYRVLYGIQGSRSQVDPDSPVAAELERAAELVRSIDGTLRSELRMLHQGAIDRLGLDALLTRLVDDVRKESSVEITLELGKLDPLSEPSRVALFRAAREAVTNARKHAAATRVVIKVTRSSHRVTLEVEDDGTGFSGEIGLGLATTRSRLEAIGGGLRVAKRDAGGTRFRAWVPDGGGVGP